MNSKVSQHLAIDLDLGPVEAIHETTVRQAKFTCGRIDAHDPQAAELALPLATVAIRVLACLDNSLLGNPVYLATGAVISFGFIQNFLVPGSGP